MMKKGRKSRQDRADAASPWRAGPAQRVRSGDAAWVADRLSARDWLIIEATNRLRLVSGWQVERLYFHPLSGHAREVVRGRVLHRLVDWQVLTMLSRRVGGAAHGSAGSVFALDSMGARLCTERQATAALRPRVRRPDVPTGRVIAHTLAVSELYADLIEQTRVEQKGAHVAAFAAEPASWWPNGLGGYLKPDAYLVLAEGSIREHWWIEVDLATESLPTIKRKLKVYLDFVARGQLGPHEIMPRVLISAPTPTRCGALRAVINRLPIPAADLFVVLPLQEAAHALLRSLRE